MTQRESSRLSLSIVHVLMKSFAVLLTILMSLLQLWQTEKENQSLQSKS